ncbi:hypothetical protein TeGR_g12647, partial [Tetraparma gracilis]
MKRSLPASAKSSPTKKPAYRSNLGGVASAWVPPSSGSGPTSGLWPSSIKGGPAFHPSPLPIPLPGARTSASPDASHPDPSKVAAARRGAHAARVAQARRNRYPGPPNRQEYARYDLIRAEKMAKNAAFLESMGLSGNGQKVNMKADNAKKKAKAARSNTNLPSPLSSAP